MSYSGGLDDDSKNQTDALSIFCREVRNLLRSKPNCVIPFSKFVPAYHNHYGRQCCVYQFGFTKLIELLEAIPHVVQIVGEGNNRYITLTHGEQIKRFASDLIKVVKSQPGKKLKLSQFPRAYEQVLGRTFRIEDYGTDDINNLLAEIWEGTLNIIPINDEYPDAWFEIPKRERSEKEVRRTKYFVRDVIELLSNMEPDYSVVFSKFIPSYHYYFNRQCKVSIFGFSKLIDLFESISPDVVEIIDQGPGEEKIIKLADCLIPSAKFEFDEGDDKIMPRQAIDNGPTEEELRELEDELKAYEELKAIQSKRSSRMAAILDIFKYAVY